MVPSRKKNQIEYIQVYIRVLNEYMINDKNHSDAGLEWVSTRNVLFKTDIISNHTTFPLLFSVLPFFSPSSSSVFCLLSPFLEPQIKTPINEIGKTWLLISLIDACVAVFINILMSVKCIKKIRKLGDNNIVTRFVRYVVSVYHEHILAFCCWNVFHFLCFLFKPNLLAYQKSCTLLFSVHDPSADTKFSISKSSLYYALIWTMNYYFYRSDKGIILRESDAVCK